LSSPPVLIDECTQQLFQEIAQKGIPAIALTANLTGSFDRVKDMEEWRINSLRKLGIDFSKSAPYKNSLVFNNLATYRGNYSTYRDGVLFVNGTTVSKGEAFLSFLNKTNFLPNKVIFIDDREENLKNVEVAIQSLPIEYQGLHYLGAQHYPSEIISEETFESKWEKLALEVSDLT